LIRTYERRKDLLETATLTEHQKKVLSQLEKERK
jgi:tRNA (guanine37-N1)-methyltransferase